VGLTAYMVVAQPFAAWCLVRQGDALLASSPEKAVAMQERAVALVPWLDVPHAHLAAACQRTALARGEPRWLHKAVAQSELARQLVPANPLYHARYGRVLVDLARAGRISSAQPWPAYDDALARDPCNLVILADAAAAAVALGEYDTARRYLARGRAAHPGWARLLAEEGIVALAEGKLVEAEQKLRLALQGDWAGDDQAFGRAEGLLALTYLQMGQSNTALGLADDVLHNPCGPDGCEAGTRWVRASALERLGRQDEARDELRRLLALRPDHAAAQAALERLSRRLSSALRSTLKASSTKMFSLCSWARTRLIHSNTLCRNASVAVAAARALASSSSSDPSRSRCSPLRFCTVRSRYGCRSSTEAR
jgi:tetratricopeptide (TPR) repeat protein